MHVSAPVAATRAALRELGQKQRKFAVLGGDEGDRTLDLRIANATLSQLSYVPG